MLCHVAVATYDTELHTRLVLSQTFQDSPHHQYLNSTTYRYTFLASKGVSEEYSRTPDEKGPDEAGLIIIRFAVILVEQDRIIQ
jgi:hypothetical protein